MTIVICPRLNDPVCYFEHLKSASIFFDSTISQRLTLARKHCPNRLLNILSIHSKVSDIRPQAFSVSHSRSFAIVEIGRYQKLSHKRIPGRERLAIFNLSSPHLKWLPSPPVGRGILSTLLQPLRRSSSIKTREIKPSFSRLCRYASCCGTT